MRKNRSLLELIALSRVYHGFVIEIRIRHSVRALFLFASRRACRDFALHGKKNLGIACK
jgi:hypothetical protein